MLRLLSELSKHPERALMLQWSAINEEQLAGMQGQEAALVVVACLLWFPNFY
jgi:hypothetical protein